MILNFFPTRYNFKFFSFPVFRYMPKIFDQFSSAEGFLFLQDNTILNYWNILQADKTKLWITNKVIFHLLLCVFVHSNYGHLGPVWF